MKVGGSDPNIIKKDRVSGASKSDKVDKSSSASESGKETTSSQAASDQISVSDLSREISKIHEEIRNNPDIRPEKVREIREKIEDGTYYVSSDEIAGKIIDDILNQG